MTYVSADRGSEGASGTQPDPFDSIYEAVRQAEPGETIHVESGRYREEIHTQQGGNPGEPITIEGPRDAVVRPTLEDGRVREGSILTINHSHVHLRGLTINGLADPDREGELDWYGEGINVHPDASTDEYLEDLVIMPAALGNSRSALLTMVRVIGAEVGGFEVIGPAGVNHLFGNEEGHNGEIVYVGTALDNIRADWYDWDAVDETRDIHVHHIDNRAGYSHAELVDAKPGTRNVTIEYCTDAGGSGRYLLPGHEHPSEAAVSLGGRDSTLRWCAIENGYGHGVKVDSWGRARQERFEEETGEPFPDAAKDAGRNNAIYGNRLLDNEGLAIRFEMDEEGNVFGYGPTDQRVICGNEINGEAHGSPEEPCPDSVPTGEGVGSSSTR